MGAKTKAVSYTHLMFLYNAALKEINTKIDILNDEFQHIYHYTPIAVSYTHLE